MIKDKSSVVRSSVLTAASEPTPVCALFSEAIARIIVLESEGTHGKR